VPGRYGYGDNNGVAIWRPHYPTAQLSTWFFYQASTWPSGPTVQWGLWDDIPVQGDYNGDGVTDMAVYRPSNGCWFLYPDGACRQTGVQYGQPAVGDYDGDGLADLAVLRSDGHWFLWGVDQGQLGVSGDIAQ
jgi:hypothetical protein